MKRKEVAVRNNPGISKLLEWDEGSGEWKDTGKRRAIRRVIENGVSRKVSAVFDSFEDAKAFRAGLLDKGSVGSSVHRNQPSGMRFAALIEKWKQFHYLKVESSTKEQYEKLLPHLEFLGPCRVLDIDTRAVDKLVEHWRDETYSKTIRRESYSKELALLRLILNFYRKRENKEYGNPVFSEHFEAAHVAKKQRKKKRALSQEEFERFMVSLKNGYAPEYYPVALAQFGLGLRVGEACGLTDDCVDLDRRVATIRWVIRWEQQTLAPHHVPRTKTGAEKIVPIPEILAVELKRIIAVNRIAYPGVRLVFHDHGKPLIRKYVCRAYNRALENAGITHVSGTHLIRHTAATATLMATGDIYAVKTLLGHMNLKTTQAYIDEVITSQSHKAADALNIALRGATDENPPPRDPEKALENEALVPLCPTRTGGAALKLVKSVS